MVAISGAAWPVDEQVANLVAGQRDQLVRDRGVGAFVGRTPRRVRRHPPPVPRHCSALRAGPTSPGGLPVNGAPSYRRTSCASNRTLAGDLGDRAATVCLTRCGRAECNSVRHTARGCGRRRPRSLPRASIRRTPMSAYLVDTVGVDIDFLHAVHTRTERAVADPPGTARPGRA
jgi:hypothetical protein